MIIGATGPLLAPFFLGLGLEKERFIATKSACQFLTQLTKSFFFFTLINLELSSYYVEIAVGFSAIIIGVSIGWKVIGKIEPGNFKKIVNVLLFILGARMLIKSALELIPGLS